MKNILLILIFGVVSLQAQISGLLPSPYFDEQVITFYYQPDIRVHINAPAVSQFDINKPTALALYALPNGNTIEQTVGKVLQAGDDWHFDIQHIGAQTRFLRQHISEYNVVTIYLETAQKSWPSWNAAHADHAEIIQQLVGYLMSVFDAYDPFIVLTGHSGGGRFTFSFLDGVSEIPSSVKRISFLDSNYGYENYYGDKIIAWLNASEEHYLSVIAYNDSVALYNGEPIVSPTGGTWYRSRMMKRYMANYFTFTDSIDADFIRYTALNGRIKFILKQNPTQAILHTVQVERNGFIQGMVSGTAHEGVDYVYYGERAYTQWIQENISTPEQLLIPPRPPNARTGSQFMQDVTNLSFAAREEQIYNEVSTGNIPDFMRSLVPIDASFQDANGTTHTVHYEVMPDYLAIGSNEDFCRIPTGPITAQRLADLFGAVMPTRKLVDNIYINCAVKLAPVTYTPVGNQNELVPKFVEHNAAIEALRIAAGGQLGQLTGGTKKDVVLSNLIIDPARPNHVVIYGWHQLNGEPIQPLTNIHINTYVDYSHGIRFLNNEFLLDGQVKKINTVLTDPVLYKVLSDENGVMVQPTYTPNTALPSKPRSFGVRSAGSGSLDIVIKPDIGTDAYRLFVGNDVGNLVQENDYTASTFALNGLADGQIYYIKLQALNSIGSSAESEVLAAIPGASAQNKVLIVNGFDRATTGNSYDFVYEHGRAVQNHGSVFESATNDAVIDGLFDLNDYAVADYILGDESTADESFSDAEQALVKTYLQNGGCLFASGSEIAWDLDWKGSSSDKSFLHNYLKVQYVADAPGGVSGTYYNIMPMNEGIFSAVPAFSFDNGTHGTINVLWPDVLQVVNGSAANLLYTGFDAGYGCAGVQFQGYFPSAATKGGVVVLGVPFESIYPESVRYQVMNAVLTYFEPLTAISSNLYSPPVDFALKQNYPNPFNPVTTIVFSLPYSCWVSLRVFDVLGRQLKTLSEGKLSAGEHQVQFNGSAYASGEYIYELKAGNNFEEQRRMLLVK
jgi:hypothetical protein